MVLLEGNAQMTIVIKITKGNDQIINVFFPFLELKRFSNQAQFENLVYINIYVYVCIPIHIYKIQKIHILVYL